MATLYISEYVDASIVDNGQSLAVGKEPAVAEQHLTISGSSAPSAAFNAQTNFIRVHTDAICSILFSAGGAAPTAVATAKRLAANQTEYFGVYPGGYLAVISNS